MVEEPFAAGEQALGYFQIFEQQPVTYTFNAFLRSGKVAVILRPRVGRQMRVNRRGKPRHERDRFDFRFRRAW
jgi:hypothetical protein